MVLPCPIATSDRGHDEGLLASENGHLAEARLRRMQSVTFAIVERVIMVGDHRRLPQHARTARGIHQEKPGGERSAPQVDADGGARAGT